MSVSEVRSKAQIICLFYPFAGFWNSDILCASGWWNKVHGTSSRNSYQILCWPTQLSFLFNSLFIALIEINYKHALSAIGVRRMTIRLFGFDRLQHILIITPSDSYPTTTQLAKKETWNGELTQAGDHKSAFSDSEDYPRQALWNRMNDADPSLKFPCRNYSASVRFNFCGDQANRVSTVDLYFNSSLNFCSWPPVNYVVCASRIIKWNPCIKLADNSHYCRSVIGTKDI